MSEGGPAGYSGTPLARKLGIVEGSVLAVVQDPGTFDERVAPLPPRVTVRRSARGRADVAVLFTTSRKDLERRCRTMSRMIHPDGAWWVAWPKRASRVPTDVTEDVVREAVLPMGLVDTKVAAIDDVWSGLRIVWRVEHRGR